MASGGRRLTSQEIAELADVMTSDNLQSLSERVLGLRHVRVVELRTQHALNLEAFKRELLHTWANMHPEPNQTQVLASLLCRAGRESGCVDPADVQRVLGVSDADLDLDLDAAAEAAEAAEDPEPREQLGRRATPPENEAGGLLALPPTARPLTNKDLQQIAWHLQDQRTVQILQQELRLRYYGISLDRPPSHFLVRWRAAQEDDVMAWHVLREVLIGCGMQHVVSTVLDRPSV